MSVPLVVFPDVEEAVTGYLPSVLDPLVGVGTRWPQELTKSLPFVGVSRSGGATYLRLVLDEPTLDFDVLADSQPAAQDLAQQVRAHMHAADGLTLGAARISRVRDTSLIWLPDPVTGTPRYVLVMSMRVRPA